MPTAQELFLSALAEHKAKNDAATEQLCERILAVGTPEDPHSFHLGARMLLGTIQIKQTRFEAAAENLAHALRLAPSDPGIAGNLAGALHRLGRREEAIELLDDTLRLLPTAGFLHYQLGTILLEARRPQEAVQAFKQSIKYSPEFVSAYVNLGQAYRDLGLLGQAIEILEAALRVQPHYTNARTNLGVVLHESGNAELAIASLREGLRLLPHQSVPHSNLVYYLSYVPGLDQQTIYLEHRQWDDIFASRLAKNMEPHQNDRDPDRPLRVGYVSSNFNEHSVAFFLEPILACHDKEQIQVFCFSNTPASDAYTSRFKKYASHWHDIQGKEDEEVASEVRQAGIDILIDLTQHLVGNRLLLFARKPAPIQITYLGYPQTTGLTAMDYRLTDPYLDPTGWNEAYNSERLLRLPRTYFCYRPPDEAPSILPLPAKLSGRVTFGCFNTLAKFNLPTARLWARILEAVPGSRLVMKARGLADSLIREQIFSTFAGVGIAAEKVQLLGSGSLSEFLAQLGDIDITLDPVPFSGGTTTCHSLWMGVPVVSLVGKSAVSRMGLSILTNAGLGELVAESADQYVAIAAALAGDLDGLDSLRREMRPRLRNSPLMDAKQFTRDLEGLYRSVWKDFDDIQ